MSSPETPPHLAEQPAPAAEGALAEQASLAAQPALVELRGITKAYGGNLAVSGVDLDLHAGAVVGLVGKNGAGKSTLIKILAGAVAPDAGRIAVAGSPVSLKRPEDANRLGLAFVHQDLVLAPNLSVAENIELGLGFPRALGLFVGWSTLRQQTKRLLRDLGAAAIDPKAPAGSLSVVEQRLVMVARALSQRARLLVLDEPTASLTPTEIAHLHRVVRGLAASGVSILYVSHRLNEILELTDRVVVMRDGRVVHDAPTAGLGEQELIDRIIGAEGSTPSAPRAGRAGERRVRGEEVLRVEHLSVPPRVADASFTAYAGEVLGIGGLVGSGRTELVRAVFGADRRSGGEVVLRGRRTSLTHPRHGVRSGIVLLPENRKAQGMHAGMAVRANITLPTLREHRVSSLVPVPARRRERATTREYVDRLSIRTSGPEQLAGALSGGNQQKVVIAKWLRHGADVFILDEPTQGVDVEGKNEIYKIMRALADDGAAVIFITSELAELEGVCDRVVVMREGRTVAELEGEEVSEAAILERCFATALA